MKKLKNRKFLVASAIVLALVITLSATFAWFTYKTTQENSFKNEGYDASDAVVINENFNEETILKIGEWKEKEVSISNTGSTPVLVRITFEEMIKLLGNDGQVTRTDSAIPGTGMIPVPVNVSLINDTNGWTEIPNTAITNPSTNVKIFEKNGIYNGYYEYGTAPDLGYQKISIAATFNPTTSQYTVTSLEYCYYTEGTPIYNSWNTKHNHADWNSLYTAGDSTIPGADSIEAFVTHEDVLLEYNTADFAATPTQNKWYYNDVDGYFYWIGVLGGGESTPMMLKKVGIDSDADQFEWAKYDYSLTVCLEVLQANKEALTDTNTYDENPNAAGWMLSDTDGIYTELAAAIDAYNA